jgi:hypothetical protein
MINFVKLKNKLQYTDPSRFDGLNGSGLCVLETLDKHTAPFPF